VAKMNKSFEELEAEGNAEAQSIMEQAHQEAVAAWEQEEYEKRQAVADAEAAQVEEMVAIQEAEAMRGAELGPHEN
jgi:hypothetical protein